MAYSQFFCLHKVHYPPRCIFPPWDQPPGSFHQACVPPCSHTGLTGSLSSETLLWTSSPGTTSPQVFPQTNMAIPGAWDDMLLRLFLQPVIVPSARPLPGRNMALFIYLNMDLRTHHLSRSSNQFPKIWPEHVISISQFHLGWNSHVVSLELKSNISPPQITSTATPTPPPLPFG